MSLPFIDVHSVDVAASSGRTWEAVVDWLTHGWDLPSNGLFARAIGCEEVEVSGPPGKPGSTVPGFRVAQADPPAQLVLKGAHRFSDYELEFRIEDEGEGRSRLTGTTHAEFPGFRGRAYKAAVIRSGAHVFFTRRMLGGIAERAEDGRLAR
jgi:hypothetical protein